jgi:hypothetical protein
MVVLDQGLKGSATIDVFDDALEDLLIFDMAKGFDLGAGSRRLGVWHGQPVRELGFTGDNRAYGCGVCVFHSGDDGSTCVEIVEYGEQWR